MAILVHARDVPACRFFETADPAPGNCFFMCVSPHPDPETGATVGLCQNIDTEEYWHIDGDKFVTLLPPVEPPANATEPKRRD